MPETPYALHIVYVCREYGPITGGGIGTYIFNVCRTMADRGHRVTLVTDCFEGVDPSVKPSGVQIVAPAPTRPLRSGRFVSANHEYTYRILDTLTELCRSESIDLIEFAEFGGEGFAAIRAKRLLNRFHETKLIVKLHTPQSLLYVINEDRQLDAGKLCDEEMEDYCVRHADMVTSPSQSLADYFADRVGRSDIRRCPYPINLPVSENPRPMDQKEVKTVRFIGSIQVRKGIDVFITAAQKILECDPSFRFEIYGAVFNASYFGQSYDRILEKRIKPENTGKIRFMGARAYGEILDVFASSCFCVFPSRWENWANVCLEAMSMGCVVIASDQGGMAEMIEDGISGFLIDPQGADQIATLVLTHFKNSEGLQRISDAARARAVRLSDPEEAARRIEANYRFTIPTCTWRCFADEPHPPRISVVIPYYNQPDYLPEAVASVRQSTYPNLEIVVVNDGSDTEAAIDAFEALEGVIKVSKANGGLSSARNAGIASASGDYILPLDADDKIHPDYISVAMDALLNNPELAYVSCHTENFGAFEDAYIPLGYVAHLMPFINTDGKCTNLFRREVFEEVGGYDEVMTSYEDWEFLIALHGLNLQGDVLPGEYFFYRRHFDSMVYQVANPQRAELIQYMMTKHLRMWRENAPLMAIVLARLWKDREILHEVTQAQYDDALQRPLTSFQVYWNDGNGFQEANSAKIHYPHQLWLDLSLEIGEGTGKGALRIDPADKPGTIRIRNLALHDRRSGKCLWRAALTGSQKSLSPAANTVIEADRGAIIVHSVDDDPQILLEGIPRSEAAMVIKATLFFGHAQDHRMVGYRPGQGKLKSAFSAFYPF